MTSGQDGPAAKRPASESPEGAQDRAKRGAGAAQAAPPPQPDLEERRRELAELYAAYDALHRTPQGQGLPEQPFLRLLQGVQGEGRAATGQQAAWAPGKPPPPAWRDGGGAARTRAAQAPLAACLLIRPAPPSPAARAGSENARRVTARLLPRYARHFPQHCDPAAEALISLSKLSLSGPPCLGYLMPCGLRCMLREPL